MKRTLYLFGKPREFFEPEITILATKRVKAAKELLEELSEAKNHTDDRDVLDRYVERYIQAEKSKNFWVGLLNEE